MPVLLERAPRIHFLRKADCHSRAAPRGALQPDSGVMEPRRVLYDGEAEARPADLPGMALIHAVKPLKHALLMLGRYPDASIADA